MLLVILFNLGGFEIFFQYMINRSDTKIIDRINHNRYRNSELMEVKIPVNLPTLQDWPEYEELSGQVQFKNNKYNYAEIRMTRDTLFLLVIPNHDRTKLIDANIIYAKQVNDIPINKKPHTSLIKKSISESECNYIVLNSKVAMFLENTKRYRNYSFSHITKRVIGVPWQPPETKTILS